MQRQTQELVDGWWSALFGLDRDELWREVTVRPHGRLGDYAGLFVAWRGAGAHVSVPADAETAALTDEVVETLQSPGFWASYAQDRRGVMIGPSTHHYLDVDPGPDSRVVAIDAAELGELRGVVSDDEWWESGSSDDDVARVFGLVDQGVLVAAATLSSYAGHPRDIGVLVAPAHRGRGLVDAVGRTAASFAIREHGLARWVARTDNHPSMAAAHRLGFEPWCEQLAVRLDAQQSLGTPTSG